MSYDPALTAIAVATNDALTEHLWRYDTATTDHGDPVAHIAIALARAALFPNTVDVDAFRVQQHIERFHARREAMLELYAVWRRHRPTTRDPRTRHLLLQPYDPTNGMVTLATDDTRLAWRVTPDATAAQAHGLRTYGDTVGEIRLGDHGWQPTAFTPTSSLHGTGGTTPQLVYPLPSSDTEAAACRALLHWCAARDDERRQQHPTQLTTAELAYARTVPSTEGR